MVNFLDVLEPLLPAMVIVTVITALVYAGSARRSRRYRPGRPFDFTPVWFLAEPEQLARPGDRAGLPAGARRGELTAGESVAGPLLAQRAVTEPTGVTGGASDRW